jgi:peptide/nickel transport system substrate-binding protein
MQMNLGIKLRNLAMGVATVALITTCAGAPPSTGPTQTQAPLVGGTVTVRLRGAVGPLEISTKQMNATANFVSQALYDTLVAIDPETADPIPYLAKSWTQTPTSLAFTLRTDAVCADGTPVTATVAKNSLDLFIKTSPAAATTVGAGPFTLVANDSAATLTVTSGTPNTELIFGFGQPGTGIVCPAGLVDPTQQQRKGFGSGPYVIDSFAEGDHFTVKVRPEWKWGPKDRTAQTPGFPEKIVFKSIDNDTTAANLLLTGGLDIADIAGPDISRLKAETSLTHRQQSNALASPLLMNMQPGRALVDEAAREAVMTAIDREAYNKAAFSGLGRVPTGGFLVKGVRCYDESLGPLVPQPSVAKAKQVLTAAGYTEAAGKFSKNGKPLTVVVLGQQATRSGVEYIAETLNAVGFTTTQTVVDVTQYSALVRQLSWDIVQLSTGGQTTTFASYMPFLAGGKMVTEGGVNRAGIFDPVVDSNYASYLSAANPADACRFMSAFQRRILEKHYVLPIVAGTTEYFGKNFAPYPTAWQIVRTKAP